MAASRRDMLATRCRRSTGILAHWSNRAWQSSWRLCGDDPWLQWRRNERYVLSIHQPHDCLLSRLCRRRSKKTSKLRVTGLCAVNSLHTWAVTRKMFPFDDVIMWCPLAADNQSLPWKDCHLGSGNYLCHWRSYPGTQGVFGTAWNAPPWLAVDELSCGHRHGTTPQMMWDQAATVQFCHLRAQSRRSRRWLTVNRGFLRILRAR